MDNQAVKERKFYIKTNADGLLTGVFDTIYYEPSAEQLEGFVEADQATFEELYTHQQTRRYVNGKVEIYMPPPLTPEEQRALMPPLEKWRFDTIIDSRPGLRDKIETAIDRNISDLLQRATVRNKFRSVTQFSRLDPMFPFLASDPDINISELEIDEMWWQGLALT